MISKELLSEVLNLNMWKTDSLNISIDENKVYCNGIFLGDLGYQQSSDVVNIYELAHKCKEWAHKSEYYINSGQMDKNSLENALKWFATIFNPHKRIGEKQTLYGKEMLRTFYLDTEPEAIFKACQWILDNKDSNDNI